MIQIALFEYESLNELLHFLVDVPRGVKGIRSKLAHAAGCQPSYLSQVLAGTANLSLEQLFGICQFLEFDDRQWEYVRELSMLEKATSPKLREDCRRRLARIRSRARTPESPAEAREPGAISADDLLWYVSNWQVNALLAAIVCPKLRAPSSLASVLGIPVARVNELIKQLIARGLLVKGDDGELLSNLPKTVYLGGDSVGQIFRTVWLNHGIGRSLGGYRDGLQKGGVFRGTKADFEALKKELAAVHRSFYEQDRPLAETDTIGYFGIELFEV